jgi:hypothetical protein
MGFHGELLFLLLGVKPAVLCTFPAAACGSCARPQLAALYASQVLLPALRSAGGAIASDTDSADPSTRSWQVRVGDKRLRLGVVNTSVESAYYEEVGGSLIVYNVDDDRAASSALRLLSPAATRVSEKELATLLDYPTYLKEGDELEDQQRRQPAIVEVGYCVMAGNSDEDLELLTSYGAEEAEVPDLVVPHFRRYAAACRGVGIALKLSITRVSD